MAQNDNSNTTTTMKECKAFNDLFDDLECRETNYLFHCKKGVAWKDINDYLEVHYGDGGKDKHWKWRGFGDSEKGFLVSVLRQYCAPHLCDCKECEGCGRLSCELQENEQECEMQCDECFNHETDVEDE